MSTDKLRILHVIPSLEKGGAQRLVCDICNELNKREQVNVLIITFNNRNGYQYLTKNIATEVVPVQFALSVFEKNRINISLLQKKINAFSPHVIHSHLFEAEMVMRWETLEGVKYFTHFHNKMEQLKTFSFATLMNKNRATNFYERCLLVGRYIKCNNAFVTISRNSYDYAMKVLPNRLTKKYLLSNAIDLERFTCNKRKKGNKLKLLNVGSLVPNKNQHFILMVMKELVSRGHDARLDIIGEGPEKKFLSDKIIEYRLENNVFLIGEIDLVEQCYNKSDIYIHAAKSEQFGLVFIEAMACGLPVVALDGKGNRDIVTKEVGFLIEKESVLDFANGIERLIDDDTLYQQLSAQASAFATDFGIKSYVDKLLDLYRA